MAGIDMVTNNQSNYKMIYIVSLKNDILHKEIQLINSLCDFEGYSTELIDNKSEKWQLFKRYYKGSNPAILFFYELDKEPEVLYGFWNFAEFLLTRGMIRC